MMFVEYSLFCSDGARVSKVHCALQRTLNGRAEDRHQQRCIFLCFDPVRT